MTKDEEFTAWARCEIPRLQRLAAALCADQHAGEDVLQNVLASVFVRWGRITHVNAYATRSIVNASISAWRTQGRRREVSLDVDSKSCEGEVSDEFISQGGEELTLLRQLPRQQRAVLALRYFEGYSEAEVAGLLEISVGTVKSHHARAVARLRKHLNSGIQLDSKLPTINDRGLEVKAGKENPPGNPCQPRSSACGRGASESA